MKIKKLLCVFLAILLALAFAGCSPFDSSIDDLVTAPKLEGEMSPVQQALEDAVGGEITLKFPTTGEYRSAFILKDLNADARREAVALYSSTTDGAVSVHINLIVYDGEEWKSVGDLSLVGNGVESVHFADLDGDKMLEIIVGWTVFGTVEKQVGIYAYDGKVFIQRAIEPYTNFICADLTSDGIDDLAAVYLNSAEKLASARVFSLSNAGITEVGKVALDGGVSSYSTVTFGPHTNGTPSLYIDAVKGTGMITEIVWFEDGVLKSIFNPELPEISLTYRPGVIASRDYNDDGIIDIPLSEVLISTKDLSDNEKVYFTNWSSFNGTEFQIIESTFMNYSDGYSISVPSEWKDKLLLIRRTEARMRFFYSYDADTGISGEEIFRIIATPLTHIENGTYSEAEYFRIETTDTLVYLAKVNPENSLGITEESVKEIFNLIK